MSDPSLHVLGIRHHGPGSARSVVAALDALAPDVVLIEGPPDAQAVLPLAAHADMVPPVALLVYPDDAPKDAFFYPFAAFSPEWRAMQWALARGVEVRFADLPVANRLASDEGDDPRDGAAVREDPLGLLAEAAGYDDRELWWEHQVEQRRAHGDAGALGLFDAILEAMTALREGATLGAEDARREAWMRRAIRAAQKDGLRRIAFVCGAWHGPALVHRPPVKEDDALLRDLPKTKTTATWIPWTYSRLSYRSGYGAGVASPGWYAHLWDAPERATVRWATRAARLLREDDLDASTASVIEAVRLAEALAALRGRPSPGLHEVRDAIHTVLCHGDDARLAWIVERLEIGEALGAVPDDAPTVPLQRDLDATLKRLRIKLSTEIKLVELDLRKDADREKSRLFERLAVLGVRWASRASSEGAGAGTFKEAWRLELDPEMRVAIVEANVHGHTIERAATAKAIADAASAGLDAVPGLLRQALRADLAGAVDPLVARLQVLAAGSSDVLAWMKALPDLARIARYGDVRGTRVERIAPIVDGILERVFIGIVPASTAIDEDAARAILEGVGQVQESIALLDRAELREDWSACLARLAEVEGVHGLLRGRSVRLLVDGGRIDDDDLARRARLALSTAADPLDATAWLEGLLLGSGAVLLHHDGVWSALDAFVTALDDEAFARTLPLVRRAFSGFSAAERRAMAEKLASLGRATKPVTERAIAIDEARGASVLPVLARILGAPHG